MTGEKYFRQSKKTNFHKVSRFLLFRQLINYDYEFCSKKKNQKSKIRKTLIQPKKYLTIEHTEREKH